MPRQAIQTLEVVSVIGASGRRRSGAADKSGGRGKEAGKAVEQAALFPDEPDTA